MKAIRLIILVALALCDHVLTGSLTCNAKPVPNAESILAGAGDAVLTAKLTKFNYLKNLKLAVANNDDGLRNLLRFTDSESFVGAGADDHCDTLYELLRFWGDRKYAQVLSGETVKVRSVVIDVLDYIYPDWHKQFPLTYGLAKHDTSYRKTN
jgi:hypothetical protein